MSTPVKTIAVIGAGTMGSGIALTAHIQRLCVRTRAPVPAPASTRTAGMATSLRSMSPGSVRRSARRS